MAAEEQNFRVWIGLGSNLESPHGDRAATLRSAVRSLARLGTVAAVSSLWETQPVGVAEQPMFLNAAAAIVTPLPPPELLQNLLQIEHEHGRQRNPAARNAARTLDLDLLMAETAAGAVVVARRGITVPHPQLHLRRFVLAPLAQIAPQVEHPVLHKKIAEILAELDCTGDNAPANVQCVGPFQWR